MRGKKSRSERARASNNMIVQNLSIANLVVNTVLNYTKELLSQLDIVRSTMCMCLKWCIE